MTAPSVAVFGERSRYLGLDYGDATIGIAVSCPRGIIATGVETLRRKNPEEMKPALARLRDLVAEYGITHIVLGNPLHMDGRASRRSEKTADFAARLGRNFKRLSIIMWDERFSTQAVARTINGKNYAARVDEMAATYILQGYLDALRVNSQQYYGTREIDMDEQIILVDEDGGEQPFDILAAKEHEQITYLLTMEAVEDEEDDAEIVHFKCIASEGDDMVFEIIDEEEDEFAIVLALFKDNYEELGIELED
ncbi:MAG: Holliday junction resolvase RuvX [Defluviitaleaceae bacterium]|nr:Holliday junction resolvase RuvX [Defluviitaleaceae bacterium]MCL2274865.1 Holliday junction resolvase RuvX [Defluviitaleaceae bacterium]